ncbi:hypothetical protein RJ639_015070 [Escallonia herrerae]|uniref:Integrase catalytic domain-containing protein n=1 Tax=Escallonia herrerae TaxID=1293975 RepID=A0AA88VP76_9ASTE|nr:hypothetical protein RJ639_015070 [Escallonia herrerae]
MTRSGSCYHCDPSVKDSTNSSPTQAAEAETLRRSIHRKRAPEFPTLEIDNLDESVKYIAFLRGLRPTSKFAFSVNKSPPDTFNLTPLNAKPSQILHEIKDNKALQWPDRMKSRPNKRNKDLWCHFHNDHGHATDNCGSLKRAIEALIKRGQLRKLVTPGEGRQQTPPAMEEREEHEENAGTINTISGGIAAGGSSGKARKAYAREVCVTSPPPNKKLKTVPAAIITFSDDDSKDIKTPHDDPVVITIKGGNFDVKWVLIDNGSSVEILFHDAFKKMNIPTDRLRKMDTPLYGFSNHPVTAEGIIALLVAIGTPPAQANFMLDFVVVKVPSAYNAILGRPALNQLQAVVSTYHLKMKFSTEHGIGEVKGDQTTARQCYVTSCRSKNKEALIIEDLQEDTKMRRGEPVAVSSAVSTVLIREEDGVQKPIYYISKVLQDVETRYPKIDKITLALIISARRLRPYFQSHTIIVLTDQPLRKVLLSPEASGRLVNWSVELGEFDIEYKPRTTIKAQALADFIVECTLPEEPPQLYALRFGFQASNNEAEYEALLVGIRLAHALKVDSLSVHIDSQLVVNHVLGDYEARDERMAQYLNLVKTSAVKFQNFTIRQIPRDQNTQADTLTRLASAEETDIRRPIYLEFLKDRSISSQTEVETIEQEPCWMDMIVTYLSTGELPSERHEARNLRVKAAQYALVEVVPLTSIVSPIPFTVWGMDLLVPFPMASGQRQFMIVAINYFTKWTEAESLATITSAKCEDFFWKNIVCSFGVPRALVVDNGKQFDNNNFRTFCTNLSINLRFTSVAHPQSNGQTENMNRSILQGLKKKLDEAKGAWVDELPKVLWAYRTTPHSVTGETPFLLCYGTEAMLPVEIGVPTIRVLHFHEVNNEAGLRANLDLLDETRTQAYERSVVIKQRVARYYNQRVRSKQFQKGDLVLRKLEVSDPKAATEKLSSNWEGPYRVIKVLKPGTYALGTLSWEPIPRTWNAKNLRKYYQ